MMTKQEKRNLGARTFVSLLFLLYLAALLKILLFRDNTVSSVGQNAHDVNLIPFQTIAEYIGIAAQNGISGMKQFFVNVFGNILIMVPFGYFLPTLWNKLKKAARVTAAATAFSVIIELLQYLWNVGSSDIDDILLNALGGFVGFLIYRWISHRQPLKFKGYLAVICLSFVLLGSGTFVAVKDYSSLLGISTTQTQTVQQANIIRYDKPAYTISDSGYPAEHSGTVVT